MIKWTLCEEYLPPENTEVLTYGGYGYNIAKLQKGISKEDRKKMQKGEINDPQLYGWNPSNGYFKYKRSESYPSCDENFNNLKPYNWKLKNGNELFGQDVKAWSNDYLYKQS